MTKPTEVTSTGSLQRESIGWRRLVTEDPGFSAAGKFPLPAYSEFMPPPRLGWRPLGGIDASFFAEDDLFGWLISEIEEEYEFRPGLERITRQIMEPLIRLGQGLPAYKIDGHRGENLRDNPYWPPELAAKAGSLEHERYVSFLPLAFSRTQDDKGRVLWTFFGGSECGPERVFWKSFFMAPGKERPEEESRTFICKLLEGAYQETVRTASELAECGFRILMTEGSTDLIPGWTRPFIVSHQASYENVHYLLTFQPFGQLPQAVRTLYLAGKLNLLPFPGSLVFWGMPPYLHLSRELPQAMQIPLLHLTARHGGPDSIRVPQTGWLHSAHPEHQEGDFQPELVRDSYLRSSRWDRTARYQNELELNTRLQKVARVLFSTDLDVLGLYDKPMARNSEIWTGDFHLLLNGPKANPQELRQAEAELGKGGLFGYRFQFPLMQVGRYSVTWHRPVAAFLPAGSDKVVLLPEALLGYLTACPENSDEPCNSVELWPRLLRRPEMVSALVDFENSHDYYTHQTSLNLVNVMDVWQRMGCKPLPRTFARSLLRIAHSTSLDDWLAGLAELGEEPGQAQRMQAALAVRLEPAEPAVSFEGGITFPETANRSFEEAYWNNIEFLAEGEFQNKDNADMVQDLPTEAGIDKAHTQRELDRLGDTLLSRHREAIRQADMAGKALCGDIPFDWKTDFDFPLFGGWEKSQAGAGHERDLLVVIPGQDRSQAVVLADHYDTAYEEDTYSTAQGGLGARRAAAGADDNYSATAVLLQAAPIFLRLSKEGRLEHDIWLLHLTGEEFPADCMGARHFSQALVEKTLHLHLEDGTQVDLSGTRLKAILLMDMIAHNRDRERDIFQISPGNNPSSLALAYQAHLANLAWNAGTREWNRLSERQGRGRGVRSADGHTIPGIAAHLELNGEVRTHEDPASSLYNTDGQIFSDIGAPVILFMENYDINRTGYHDSHDTMENIDLDYGAALAAIVIETAARLATSKD